MKYVITLDEDEIPENCSECSFSNHCGECLADGGRCDYESKIRPSSCPIKNLSDIEEYNNLKKAHAEVCAERDMLKDKIISIKKIANIHYGLTEKIDVISPESYEAACKERDKLKEENKTLYRLCNQLLAEQRGDYNDGLPKIEGELLTENDIF